MLYQKTILEILTILGYVVKKCIYSKQGIAIFLAWTG